jgi:tetratricopeptide (TPR) repeat protein
MKLPRSLAAARCLLVLLLVCGGACRVSAEAGHEKEDEAIVEMARLCGAHQWAKAEKAAKALVAARTQSLGAEHKDTLHARILQEEITTDLSREAEAAAQLQELLPVVARVFGKEDRETLRCQADRAAVLVAGGRCTEALKACRSLRPVATRVLGAEDRITLKARRVEVRALIELRQLDAAQKEITKVYSACQHALGAEDRDTLEAGLLWVLATTPTPKAVTDSTPAPAELLPQLTQALGAEHRATLVCQSEMSLRTGSDAGRPDATTEKELRRVIALQTRALGAGDLSIALDEEGKITEAAKMAREVAAAYERVFGPEDGGALLSCLTSLMKTLKREHQHAQAVEVARKLITIATRVLGPENLQTLRMRLELADSLEELKEYREAEQERLAVLAVQDRTLGRAQVETLTNCHNLAVCLMSANQNQQALPYAQRSLEGKRKAFGPKDPRTQEAQRLLDVLKKRIAKG